MSKSIDSLVDKEIKKAMPRSNRKYYNDAALLKEDLSLDSLNMVARFTGILDKLDIDIDSFEDEELVEIKSVSDLKQALESKLALQ